MSQDKPLYIDEFGNPIYLGDDGEEIFYDEGENPRPLSERATPEELALMNFQKARQAVEGELEYVGPARDRNRLEFIAVSHAFREVPNPGAFINGVRDNFKPGRPVVNYEVEFTGPPEAAGFLQPPGAGVTVRLSGPGTGGELFDDVMNSRYKITIERIPLQERKRLLGG